MVVRTVLGAGHWGTALAVTLARRGDKVRLWGRSLPDLARSAESILPFFPQVLWPPTLTLTCDWEEALRGSQELVIAIPSHGVRDSLRLLRQSLPHSVPITLASKGLERDSQARLDEVVAEEIPQWPWGVLSGPSFASDLAYGRPLAMTLASHSAHYLDTQVPAWRSEQLRIYPSSDVAGVCLAGAIKNVLAIAAGISDGLGHGDSARAALITRGLAELLRLGVALGGQADTFFGLAGAGDLILTASSDLSRNRRLGLGIGAGKPPAQVLQELGEEVEGWRSSFALYHLAQARHIEMPIVREVYRVLYEGRSAEEASRALMQRVQTEAN
ncbi:NAD(P)H-dependent glycerol-3-phosphate dehydrogenase [Acidithiobacillus sp. IBUN Pt1247-S3]|uniref:NAD(P)H-dependent glycerol-3-phosphate dehydrogenase n=1 Tax=Acidithiobacillus sp. IBUN Pt1247-S3 TaxID=3166642 RepID=UPI0034E60A8B